MLFSSEQVSNGHPDKICDQISDAIVTDILQHDELSRIAAETIIKDYEITVMPDIEDNFMKYISKFADARAEATLKENLGVLYQYHKEIKRIMSRDRMQCIMEPIEIR